MGQRLPGESWMIIYFTQIKYTFMIYFNGFLIHILQSMFCVNIAYHCVNCQEYVRDPNRRFAADAVAAIGLCTLKLPDVATTCLEGLLTLALCGNCCSFAMELIQLFTFCWFSLLFSLSEIFLT